MPAVLETGPTATQNSPFLPQQWPKPLPVLILLLIIIIIIQNLYSAIMPLGGYRGAGGTGR